MTHQQIIKLYRSQGRLAGLVSRANSLKTLNERLRDATDSLAAGQAYTFNHEQADRIAVTASDILAGLEQITKELENA